MIDPGMGWKGFFRCVEQVEPRLSGIPAAHLLRPCAQTFSRVKVSITLRRFAYVAACHYQATGAAPFRSRAGDEWQPCCSPWKHWLAKAFPTLIAFRHSVETRREYGIRPEKSTGLLVIFLFSVALGATAAIPDMTDAAGVCQTGTSWSRLPTWGDVFVWSPTLWERAHACVTEDYLPAANHRRSAGAV